MESLGVRNQSITDFFKPVPKQDRLVLNSPQRTNHKYERGGLLDTGIGQFERKISATKNMCKKMSVISPNKSPIIETLMRRFKEKKGERDAPERNQPPVVQKTQSLVVEKPRVSTLHRCMSRNEMKDPRKQERSPFKMSSHNHGNMREKAECIDQNQTITDAKNLVSSPKPEILKNNSSKIGGRNDISRCQQLECSVKMQQEPVESKLQLSLKSSCREGELKEQSQKLLKHRVISPEEAFSGESSLSSEPYNIDTKFTSRQERTMQNIIPEKSRLSNQVCENGCRSRKRLHSDSLEAASGRIIQLNRMCNYSHCKYQRKLVDCGNFGYIFKHSSHFYLRNSHIFKTSIKLSENTAFYSLASDGMKRSLAPLSILGTEFSGMSDAKTCVVSSSEKEREVTFPKAPITYPSVSPRIKKQTERNFEDVANTSSMKSSSKSLPFQNGSIIKSPPAVLGDVVLCSTSISMPSCKNLENSSSTSSTPRKKLKVYLDSDEENLDCNLESDEEDVALKPLQEIMSLNSSQPTTPEKPFVLLEKPRALSSNRSLKHKFCLSCHSFTSSRSDKWEKELKEDLVKGQGIKSLMETEESENTDDSGELQEEHREFIRKFFIAFDTIPDCHPGEEIFHCFDYGKIFSQHTLDLRDCNFVPKNAIEDLILKSGRTQQIFLTTQGYLSTAYYYIQCPIPVLKWLFQMMSVHTDYVVSIQLLNTLIDLTVRNDATSGSSVWPWIPSLSDIATVFVNMGVSFKCLFPVRNLQPVFNEDIFNFEVQSISEERKGEDSVAETVVSCLPETNILNVVKFIGLCTAVYPEGYTDQEIILLLLMFLKMSLEKHLKQIALVDFQSLLINLLKNIRDWDAKMPELCMAISELSTHHHNLLWLVQFIPNWTVRGRQVRQHLSLVIIAKFLDKKPEDIPSASDLQLSLLCQYLTQMKPDLLRKIIAKKTGEQQDNLTKDCLGLDLEQQVCFKTRLFNKSTSLPSFQKWGTLKMEYFVYLLQLCGSLEQHIKCSIREDARFFHRTKVIDLVAIIHGKWQEMIQNSRPIQGKLHDFWVPDS
uniref:Coiled-coil SMC6 And NSE5 INteracting (CANIN) domain-containing protein n=1 Tax=Vombatus ursinus TaxID=29139 RepID=A0A4X2JWA0_VOMUR